jgi:glycosyltransferase involved in cell wall biosynthesis
MRVVVFSEVKWRYMRTRKRFLLSRFPPDWPILFLEPLNRTDRNPLVPVREGRVTVAALPVLKPQTTFRVVNALLGWAWVRGLLTFVVQLWVRLLLWRFGWFTAAPEWRLIYLSNVLFIPVAERLPRDLLLYDANDDPVGFPGSPPWVGPYLDRTLKAADLVVSCSEALAVRLRRRGTAEVMVVGNGAEVEHFAGPVDPSRLPAAVRNLKRPCIGYAGAIAEWFDFELVGEVAQAHPQASVVVVGPVAAPVAAEARALARAHSNVIFPGRVPYEDLPHVVGSFDVCLIPFRFGPATDVLNPNKVYEYLAAGRTVVSLAYSPDLERLKEWIFLARDRREFVAQVGEAITSPHSPATLHAVAARHSWDQRARELLDLIRARLDSTGGGGERW